MSQSTVLFQSNQISPLLIGLDRFTNESKLKAEKKVTPDKHIPDVRIPDKCRIIENSNMNNSINSGNPAIRDMDKADTNDMDLAIDKLLNFNQNDDEYNDNIDINKSQYSNNNKPQIPGYMNTNNSNYYNANSSYNVNIPNVPTIAGNSYRNDYDTTMMKNNFNNNPVMNNHFNNNDLNSNNVANNNNNIPNNMSSVNNIYNPDKINSDNSTPLDSKTG